jgi:predicted TPR repeat methyltransferase
MTSKHDKYAKEYDEQIRKNDCYIAEVLFGLSYEMVKKDESLLDVGIGTGVSSEFFRLAGLRIFGIDESTEMLEICRKKNITQELVSRNIQDLPWPYKSDSIDHIISCGVFHFIEELTGIFTEIARIQKTNGIFAFTIMKAGMDEESQQNHEMHMEDDIKIFAHKMDYIYKLLKVNQYEKKKEIICFVGNTPFRAVLAQSCKAK